MPRRFRRSRIALAGLMGLTVGIAPISLPIGPRVEIAAADTSFTFDGGGFGHGVGMSQYGALGMAKAGFTAPQILAHYYQGTSLAPISQISNLRVRLVQRASTFVTPSGTLHWYLNGVHCAQSPANEPVEIRAVGGGALEIRGLNGTGPPTCSGGAGSTLAVDYGATADVAGAPVLVSGTPAPCPAAGCRYRWGWLAVRGDGNLLNIAIEQLPMERYLRGLAEVPSSWPAAALQTQAIAGRSYAEYQAIHRRSPNPDPGFDVWATTADQAYSGYEKEAAASGNLWVAAVDATAHQVSTTSNQVIQAFYSSSSGGHTENSEYVFVTPRSYLKGVADPYDADPTNANRSWSRSYSGSELGSWVAARYGSIGSILDLSITGPLGVSGRTDKATVRIFGSSGSLDLTGSQFRSMVNAYAGSGRTLLSTRFTLRPTAPFGSLDSITRAPGGVRVNGWAIDPLTTDPIAVHVYVDGAGAAVLSAGQSRPDVGAAYPAYGSAHGFNGAVPVPAGSHTVCVYAVGQSRNSLISCRRVTIATNPFGSIDAASSSFGRLQMSGWAIDPDTAAAVEVHVYVDGAGAAVVRADRSRPDVGRVYPSYGSAHGFTASIATSEGSHTACAYAINAGAGSNVLLGCRTVDVRQSPIGSVDRAARTSGGIRVSGWALDPETAGPIDIHVYVDGAGVGLQRAAGQRPDIAGAFPGYGAAHGFDLTVPGSSSARTVCVYAINVGRGGNRLLGCRSL